MVIRSTGPLFIQLASGSNGLMDAAQLLPVTYASKWFVGAYSPVASSSNLNAYYLLNLENSTNVVQVNEKGSGFLQLSLQSLVPSQRSSSVDLTGTSVTSDHDLPLVVMTEMNGVLVPENFQSPGYLLEQMPPVSDWGTTFIVPSIVGIDTRGVGFVVRVIAGHDNTIVSYTDNYNTVLGNVTLQHSGDGREIHCAQDSVSYFIKCSMPCLVEQYNSGYVYLASMIDRFYSAPGPFMLTIPPISHYTTNVSFSTVEVLQGTQTLHFLRIAVVDIAEIKDSICLDDETPCGAFSWKETVDIDGEFYSLGWLQLEPGFHTIFSTHPNATYCIFVYGHNDVGSRNGSYGYTATYKSMSLCSGLHLSIYEAHLILQAIQRSSFHN